MFKNDIVFTQSYPLSKKERKEICSSLALKFDKAIVDYISSNMKSMTIQKGNILGHKRNVLVNEANPILFEYDAKVYFPTVYLLQMCNYAVGRNIINKVALIYEETIGFIENGADLMLKGVLNRNEINLMSFPLNDLFYVQTITGKPVAIGVTLVSKQILNIDNPSGKFLKIIHRIGDSLWSLGNKKEQALLPIESIIEEVKSKTVPQVSEVIEISNESNLLNKDEEQKAENNQVKEEKGEEGGNEIVSNEEDVKLNHNEEEKKLTDDVVVKADTLQIEKEEKEHTKEETLEEGHIQDQQDEHEEGTTIMSNENPEEIDNNLDIVFLTLCKLHLQNEKFPIDPGKLLKDFMKPVATQLHLNINLKQSSHKKINTYLKHLQKEKQLVTFSKAKGQTNDYLQSVNWNSNLIKDFTPRIKKVKLLTHNEDANQHDNILLSKDEKIIVAELFKPNQKIKALFSSYIPSFNDKDYYTLRECTEVVTKYLQAQSLFILSSPGKVHLDKYLEEMLNVHHKDFSMTEREYAIEDVLDMWKRNLNKKSCIMKTSTRDEHQIEEVVYSKEVTIRIVAKKIQNKNVTLIEGLDKFIEVKDVTKALAKQFAASVTIKDIQGMKNVVFIQGYWVNELVAILTEEFKLKKSLIKVEDRLKLKRNK